VSFKYIIINLSKAMNRKKGIQWGLYDRLQDLDFADDICLLAQIFKDVKAKLNDLKVEAQNTGMKINSQKTKEMRVHPKNKDAKLRRKINSAIWDAWSPWMEVPTKT
jgi:hypothetical protein